MEYAFRIPPDGLRLPAAGIAERVNQALRERGTVVVSAPPGAGKSTLLPLTILQDLPAGSRILMLEPRRLAARQIASRMAALLGEPVGQTVGYRIRFDSCVSDRTRIEVLTEGILVRRLVEDPALDGVSAVIFDEFHERSLPSDVALAMTREARQILRPDLRLVLMSATIDTRSLCDDLDAPLVEGRGRMFPVTILRPAEEATPDNASELAVKYIRQAHRDQEGDILAFLPGEADIRRCRERLDGTLGERTRVCPLYGLLSNKEQREAIAPSPPGERKVVLATPIAETSLTIEGIRTVVDTGLFRNLVFDPQRGLSHLETVRISKDMADQRTGRAGRLTEGVCYRLWSLGTEQRMAPTRKPEIEEADLAPTVLEIAAWGESRPQRLPWLTPPPPVRLAQARDLLRTLGALDADGQITSRGKRLASLPCHPRIARMLIEAETPAQKALACDLAALLEEKDPLSQEGDTGLDRRLNALRDARRSAKEGRWSRILKISEQYRTLLRAAPDNSPVDPYEAGVLVAAAYPERIAKTWKEGHGCFQLAGGDLAEMDENNPLSASEWIAVADLNARKGAPGRIFLAAPVDPGDLARWAQERDSVTWDSREGAVTARREARIGRLVLSSRPVSENIREQVTTVLCEAARKEGRSMLDFSDDVKNLQRRVAALAAWHPELDLPDLGTDAVLERASQWLPLYAGGATTAAELRRIDMCHVLWGMLSYDQQQAAEQLAPSHVTVPTGSRIPLEYRQGAETPVLRVRLQECFGLVDTPRIDGGRRPVLMELLSPGYKSVQLTTDLHSFWQDTYFEVRKELRRRYPKHAWPDNPLEAAPVRGVPKRS